ncbi:MAG: hypothetical protein ACYC1Q_04945, partial [Bacteroidia bacterium]
QFPVLNEKRKVYWEDDLLGNNSGKDWFPKETPSFTPAKPGMIHLFDGWKAEQKAVETLPKKTVKQEYVLCYDGSYSMNAQSEKLIRALEAFPYKGTTPLYVFDRNGLREADWAQKNKTSFLGTVDPYQAFVELQKKHPQAHLILICDKGSYELMPEESRVFKPGSNTIDLVHLDEMAPIYEDAVADAVRQSGGDMYQNMDEWLLWHDRIPEGAETGVRDGKTYWSFSHEPGFSVNSLHVVAASRLALAKGKKADLAIGDMDSLHKMAMEYSFVSPYSSMICLVNDAQRQSLEALSEGEDRYQREVETGKESGNAFDIGAKGVPEPEEWVMIVLAGGLILFLYWKERKKNLLRG